MSQKKYVLSEAPHLLSSDHRLRRDWIKFAALIPALLVLFVHDPVETLKKTTLAFGLVWIFKTGFDFLFKRKEKGGEGALCLTALLLALFMPPGISAGTFLVCVAAGLFLSQEVWGGNAFYPQSPVLVSYCLFKLAESGKSQVLTNWAFSFWNPFTDFWHVLICAAILLAGVILLLQKVISWKIPALYLGLIFTLYFGMGIYSTMPLAGLLLAGFYFVTDSVSTPMTEKGVCSLAGLAALLTIVLDLLNAPADFAFALLISTLLTPWLDQWILPAGVRS